MAINIEEAVLAINPDAAFSCIPADNKYESIIWRNGTSPISKEDVEAKLSELQADYDAKQYQRNRNEVGGTNVYPDIGDQLDMLWHDKKDGTTTWEDAIQAVKDAHPKP